MTEPFRLRSGSRLCAWCSSTREYATPWAASRAIAEQIGCSAEALLTGCAGPSAMPGQRPGLTAEERARFAALAAREHRELERANGILRKASAYVTRAELARPSR